jgi:hypothetical protein
MSSGSPYCSGSAGWTRDVWSCFCVRRHLFKPRFLGPQEWGCRGGDHAAAMTACEPEKMMMVRRGIWKRTYRLTTTRRINKGSFAREAGELPFGTWFTVLVSIVNRRLTAFLTAGDVPDHDQPGNHLGNRLCRERRNLVPPAWCLGRNQVSALSVTVEVPN